MTLAARLLDGPNGLTMVRLVLASWVIALHAWTVGGFDPTSPFYLAAPVGQWAIPGFFALSGFLIARSRMRLPLGRFLFHRALRIFPGYWVCIVVVAFVLAPLSTTAGGSWSWGRAADFVLANLMVLRQLAIPGTVDDHAWDVSLWTLTYELLAYMIAGLLLTGASRRQATTTTVVLVIALGLGNAWVFGQGHAPSAPHVAALQLGSYFAAGMLFYFLSSRILCSTSWALAALASIAAAQLMGVEEVVGPVPVAYLVLWAGAAWPARWSLRSDLSYGVYIYAFPVQVLLEWYLPDLGLTTHIAAAFVLTLPFALLSWHLVERPALRLKDVFPPGDTSPTTPPAANDPSAAGTRPPTEIKR